MTMKKLKPMKIFWLLFVPALAYGLYVVAVLAYGTLNDFQPEEIISIQGSNEVSLAPTDSTTLSFMIWNIGYGGLGAQSDFFLDGGTMVRPSKELSDQYRTGILKTIEANSEVDFLMLQEVDVQAKRSYKLNQFEAIGDLLPNHTRAHAFNFNVNFVPKPLVSFSPIGKVQSGLATYSKYQVSAHKRFQFPGSYGWPTRAFHLDRCLLESRIPLANGKELIVLNSHNSAYDGGKLKPQEMAYLKAHLLAEYEKGNYLVVGSDWNQCPPNFPYDSFSQGNAEDYYQDNIAPDFMPADWQWAFDGTVPTNRKLASTFDKETTFTTLIDFYLLSPNITLESVEGVSLNFEHSDHQPVKLNIQLK